MGLVIFSTHFAKLSAELLCCLLLVCLVCYTLFQSFDISIIEYKMENRHWTRIFFMTPVLENMFAIVRQPTRINEWNFFKSEPDREPLCFSIVCFQYQKGNGRLEVFQFPL